MIVNLLKDLVSNLAIFASTSFLIYLLMRNHRNYKDFHEINPNIPFAKKISLGIIDGLIGTTIMFYGISIGDGILVDLRHLSIAISALFGGIPAALTTGIMIACSRFVFFDASEYSTLLGMTNALNMALGCGIIATFVCSRKKWILMNLYCLLSITIVAILLLNRDWYTVMVPLSIISIISAVFIFYLHNYLVKTMYLQNIVKENDDKFRAITENVSDVVSIIDIDGKTSYVSPSISDYGISVQEYEGKHPREFIHSEDRSKVIDKFRECINDNRMFKTEFRWKSPNGKWIDVDVRGTPIIENNVVTKVVVVCRDATERKKVEQKLFYLSNVDGLTGVANRRFFDETLEKEWHKSKESSSPLSLIMFDIDYFKLYNDTYGHQSGDICLQNIASYVKEVVKTPNLVARYGGEEFAVILLNTTESNAMKTAESIRIVVESLHIPHQASKKSEVVTVSVGVATQDVKMFESQFELIDLADQALYQAKKNGRNRVETFSTL